jgi:hypothetical protein
VIRLASHTPVESAPSPTLRRDRPLGDRSPRDDRPGRVAGGTWRDVVDGVCGVAVMAAALATPFDRRRRSRWGMGADVDRAHPGDDLVDQPRWGWTHGIEVAAPADEVWPWVAQIGADRGGFYSYEWLENLAGCKIHNAQRIHAEWQHRTVGDQVRLHPAGGLRLLRFDQNEALAMEGGWNLALRPIDRGRSRLYARSRQRRNAAGAFYVALIELPHFIMERKMLLGIKQRAEKLAHQP